MEKTTRITITAREKDNIENLDVVSEAWHDGESLEVRHNEFLGIMQKAVMQQLGAYFMQGARDQIGKTVAAALDLHRTELKLANSTLEVGTKVMQYVIDANRKPPVKWWQFWRAFA